MAKNAVSVTKQTSFGQYVAVQKPPPDATSHHMAQFHIASQKGQEIEQDNTGLSSSFIVY